METLFAMLTILAQTAQAPTTRAADRPFWVGFFENPLMLMAGLLLLMYFFMMKGNKNKERERQQMLEQLKKGDRVQTIGGILGTVIETREGEVLLKVDESSNAKIWFTRAAIHKVRTEEKK